MADYEFDQNVDHSGGMGVTLSGGTAVAIDVVDAIETKVELAPIELKPTSVSSTIDLKPVQSSVTLDMKPLQSDVCARISFGPVPPTRVHQPYQHSVRLSWFGIEILKLELCGEAETSIAPAKAAPAALVSEMIPSHPRSKPASSDFNPPRRSPPSGQHQGRRDDGGIRIRIE